MDQQPYNPYVPQGAPMPVPDPFQGQQPYMNPNQQAYQQPYGEQPQQFAQQQFAQPQQQFAQPQPDLSQNAWQQDPYQVQAQSQSPYGYPAPQSTTMPMQDPSQIQNPQPMSQPYQDPGQMQGQMPNAMSQPYPMAPAPQAPYGAPMPAAAPYQAPQAPPTPQTPQGEQKLSGLAIAGMVIGIVSLVCSPIPIVNNFVFFVAIVGLVLSVIGFLGIRKNPAQKGKGMAIAGIALAAVAIVLVFASQAFYGAVLDEVSNQIDEAASSYTGGPSAAYTPPSDESSSVDSGLAVTGSPTDSGGSEAPSSAGTGQDMALGTAAAFDDGTAVTVVSVTPGLANYDGSPVTCVTVQYTNEGAKNISFNPYDWKAQDPQGAQRSETYFADEESPLHAGEVTPGGTVTGNLYFDEPIAKIVYSPSMFSSDGDVSWIVS